MSMIKSVRSTDMLHGSLWDKILLFALPLAASSIIQQLFNSADVAVVGQFVGRDALAAVGANSPVINMMVNLFVGLSVGANVVISRAIGQESHERVHKAVHTSVLLALISGVFLAVIGVLFAEPILLFIATPDNIIELAASYLRIYFAGMPFIMLYNFEAAILRSKGDTKRPLFTLLCSGVLNVLLNVFFVLVCGMSVDGVALATVISNVLSSLLLLYFLCHEDGSLKLELKELKIDKKSLVSIAKIGIPAGLQGMVFSISNVCIQSALNKLGSDVIAASAAAINYEYFSYFIISAFGQAAVTFIGQNYGAGNFARCRKITRLCLLMGSAFTILITCCFVLFREFFVSFFTTDPAVAALAAERVRIILTFQIVNMVTELLSGAMRGLNHSLVPALICVAGVCGLRITWVYTMFAQSPEFTVLMSVYPISWVVTASAITVAYFFVLRSAEKKLQPREKLKTQ